MSARQITMTEFLAAESAAREGDVREARKRITQLRYGIIAAMSTGQYDRAMTRMLDRAELELARAEARS